jgi:UDP-N-acetylmuramate dehydrogenase
VKSISVQENISLAPFTTLKVGGKARFFVSAETEQQVLEAIAFAEEYDLDVFILGGGSNVLIADAGFEGLVVQINLQGIETAEKDGSIYVTAQAGEDWDEFAAFCVGKNLQGIECLSGIPGFVGGTPVQNVGAYGQEVSETIAAVRVFDRKTREILELTNADCGFRYRQSIFNTKEKNRFIVLAVTFALKSGGEPKIVYKDLLDFFAGKTPTLAETRQAVCRIRAEKAMLVRQGGVDSNSVGSFFKNPVVSKGDFQRIVEIAKKMGFENVPNFAVGEENIKIPAAWLIEKSGFRKGYIKGRAGLSSRHTLALINRGSASAAEILRLKDEIQAKVKNTFNTELKVEPVFIGFDQ